MSKWVYGDIHGSGHEFRTLVRQLHQSGDEHFCVGDLFDRGLDAVVVWETLQEYGIKSTRGNHEQKMLRFLEGKRDSVPPHYHYALNQLIGRGVVRKDDFIAFLHQMPNIIRVAPNGLVTHGGVNVTDPWLEDDSANIYGHLTEPIPRDTGMGSEHQFWWDHYHLDTVVFYGHIVHEPGTARIRRGLNGAINSVGLDTFVVHGGPLTAVNVDTLEVVQYRTGNNYYDMLKELHAKEFKKFEGV